jgi:hypothetical protein
MPLLSEATELLLHLHIPQQQFHGMAELAAVTAFSTAVSVEIMVVQVRDQVAAMAVAVHG